MYWIINKLGIYAVDRLPLSILVGCYVTVGISFIYMIIFGTKSLIELAIT